MLCAPFTTILAAGRAEFNLRAAQAKRRYPAFDMDAFGQFLDTGVDAVVDAVAAVSAQRLPSVVQIAYDMALELTGQVLVGPRARSALAGQAWCILAPRYAALISLHPWETLAMLTNAAIHLESISGSRPAQWMAEMAAIAPLVESLPQLQAVGQVLAWRAGVAHFRSGAIEAADRLPEALALAAVGVGVGPWAPLRAQMRDDPWWRAGADANGPAGREVGAFTGLGGQFPVPPQVRPCAGGFLIKCGERYFLLVADAFGAVLHGATPEEFEHAGQRAFPAAFSIDGSTLLVNRRRIALDLPAAQLAACCNDTTIAVTSPCTHAVVLLPLR